MQTFLFPFLQNQDFAPTPIFSVQYHLIPVFPNQNENLKSCVMGDTLIPKCCIVAFFFKSAKDKYLLISSEWHIERHVMQLKGAQDVSISIPR